MCVCVYHSAIIIRRVVSFSLSNVGFEWVCDAINFNIYGNAVTKSS